MLVVSAGILVAWQKCHAQGCDFFGPRDPRSQNVRPWGQVVLLGFLSMFVVGIALAALFANELRDLPEDTAAPQRLLLQLEILRWGVLGNAIILALVLAFSFWQVKLTAGEQKPWLGLLPNGRDVRNGVLMGLVCTPLLLIMQGLLQALSQQFLHEQQEHPYIEMIRKNKDIDHAQVFELLGWITLSVTIIAPILEELLFRGLLQGWLRGKYQTVTDRILPRSPSVYDPTPVDDLVLHESGNPYEAPQVRVTLAPAELQRRRLVAWAPVFITSGAFAVAHLGHGPAPIPLFLFSLALGYLYEKTGRLAPSIIAHFMLNLCTSILLWVAIMYRLPWD